MGGLISVCVPLCWSNPSLTLCSLSHIEGDEDFPRALLCHSPDRASFSPPHRRHRFLQSTSTDKPSRLSIRVVILTLPSDTDTLFGDNPGCISK